jgi:hypothetical protein
MAPMSQRLIQRLTGRQWCEWWFRLQEGHFCTHERWPAYPESGERESTFTPWTFANSGANKYRWCRVCNYWEWV